MKRIRNPNSTQWAEHFVFAKFAIVFPRFCLFYFSFYVFSKNEKSFFNSVLHCDFHNESQLTSLRFLVYKSCSYFICETTALPQLKRRETTTKQQTNTAPVPLNFFSMFHFDLTYGTQRAIVKARKIFKSFFASFVTLWIYDDDDDDGDYEIHGNNERYVGSENAIQH